MKAVFVVFDTETTGLEPESCEVIEIAGVKFNMGDDGKPFILDQYTSLVRIDGSIPPRASAVNKIYDSMLFGQPGAKEAIGGFFRWVGLSPILLAHHAPFDVAFLGNAIQKNGLPLPRNPTFCTKRMACRLFPEIRHRLKDMEENLLAGDADWGRTRKAEAAHRALYDSTLLAHVFAAMMRRKATKDVWADPRKAIKLFTNWSGESLKFDRPLTHDNMKQDFLAWEAQCKV